MADPAKVRLTIPRQDLTAPSAFRPNSQAAREWLQQLPVTRVLDCARQLADALAELNRTRLAPEQRFGVLEVLYPSLDGAVASLTRRFLNQPLVMPEGPRTMAELTARLLGCAGMGYTIVAVETIQRQDAIREMNPARLACEAIQRGLLCYGRRVLQHFQLYHPLAIQEWQVLHQLYSLAERQQLEALPLPEPLSGGATIRATYLQSLLLSCSKPNQLRQADMAILFHALAEWAERVAIARPGGDGGLFVVDLNSDQPPLYSSLLADRITDSCRYLQTAALVAHLTGMRDAQETTQQPGTVRSTLQLHLLDHLVAALGSMSLRNFKRTPSDAPLRVCLGLSSTHYHVAGQRDFERLLEGSGYTREALREKGAGPFLKPPKTPDIWELANPGGDHLRDEHAPQENTFIDDDFRVEVDARTRAQLLPEDAPAPPRQQRYPVYEVRLADASPGGYCLEWAEALPANLRTGDIVGLMEQHSRDWVIAVIRWLSTLESARTLIGLELLSPRAQAFGAVIHHAARGDKSPPLRALLLPEIKLVGQPETLITPRASFRERQRVTLISDGDSRTVQLCQLVAQTPGYLQFEFRVVRELGDVLATEQDGGHGKPFDSLWSNI